MSLEQDKLLARFKEVFGDPTYKEMSEISGINLTRIFRLNNGFEMKMGEYLKIKKCVDEKIATSSNIKFLFESCLEKLSVKVLKDLEVICARKLEMSEMLKVTTASDVVA